MRDGQGTACGKTETVPLPTQADDNERASAPRLRRPVLETSMAVRPLLSWAKWHSLSETSYSGHGEVFRLNRFDYVEARAMTGPGSTNLLVPIPSPVPTPTSPRSPSETRCW